MGSRSLAAMKGDILEQIVYGYEAPHGSFVQAAKQS